MQYSTVHRGNMCLDEHDWRSKSVDRKRLKFATLLMKNPIVRLARLADKVYRKTHKCNFPKRLEIGGVAVLLVIIWMIAINELSASATVTVFIFAQENGY